MTIPSEPLSVYDNATQEHLTSERLTDGHEKPWAKYNRSTLESSFRLDTKKLAEDLMAEDRYLALGGALWRYSSGLYKPGGEVRMRIRVQQLLGEVWEYRHSREVETYIRQSMHREPEDLLPPKGIVNVQNGLYDIATGELRAHSPDVVSLCQLPVDYDPKASDPAINRFMVEVLPWDAIPVMWEFIGYCLIPVTLYEKALLLTGRGANGKSTLMKMVVALLGVDNVSSVSLQNLTENRFMLAQLQGKLANIYPDLEPGVLKTPGVFKAVVSGEHMEAERKYGNPFRFQPHAKLIFAANELPRLIGNTEAIIRRLIIVDFPNQFPPGLADVGLAQRLMTPVALSTALNRALAGLRRLQEQGQFSSAPSVTEAVSRYREASDPIHRFLRTCCTEELGKSVAKAQLYQAYSAWAESEGERAATRETFFKRVQGRTGISASRPRVSGSRERILEGIALTDLAEHEYLRAASRSRSEKP